MSNTLRSGEPKRRLFMLLAFVVAACGSPEEETKEVRIEPTFASIQANLFDARCTSCHNAGRPGDLDLRSGQSYGELINVPPNLAAAVEAGLTRVKPGDAANSFLFVKLAGPDAELGRRMPIRGDILTADQLEAVRTWIAHGAPK